MSRALIKSASFEGANGLIDVLSALNEHACDAVGDWTPVSIESDGFALQGYAVLTLDDEDYTIEIVDKATPEILAVEAA